MTDTKKSLYGGPLQSRRGLLMGAAVLATVGVGASLLQSFFRSPRADADARKQAKRPRRPTAVASEELMKAGPLPELTIGRDDAPVTIVEYASMTCGACATFHTTVLPVLKEKYIDTGKVRLVFREFPLDERAALASMVTRCVGSDKTFPLISVLLSKQDEWAFSKTDFQPKLFAFAQQAGFTQAAYKACRENQDLIKKIIAVRDRAHQSFGVTQTPTFFVNGKKLDGGSIEAFEKAIAPLLKG